MGAFRAALQGKGKSGDDGDDTGGYEAAGRPQAPKAAPPLFKLQVPKPKAPGLQASRPGLRAPVPKPRALSGAAAARKWKPSEVGSSLSLLETPAEAPPMPDEEEYRTFAKLAVEEDPTQDEDEVFARLVAEAQALEAEGGALSGEEEAVDEEAEEAFEEAEEAFEEEAEEAFEEEAEETFEDEHLLPLPGEGEEFVEEEEEAAHEFVPMERSEVKCKYFFYGMCKRGDDCEFLHELPETEEEKRILEKPACMNFPGRCKYGARCNFRHVLPDGTEVPTDPKGPSGTYAPPRRKLPTRAEYAGGAGLANRALPEWMSSVPAPASAADVPLRVGALQRAKLGRRLGYGS